MAKIVRKVAKIFGSTSGPNQIAKFGSFAAGSVAYSTDPATIQSLGNWLAGWYDAVLLGNSPAIQDMNAFCFVMAYQIAYLMQEGAAEWESGTTYYIGSLAQDGAGNVYTSLTDTNLNHALSDTTKWALQSFSTRTSPGATAALGQVAISASSGTFSTSSTSYVDVTNLSVTVTTAGRPVFVSINPQTGASGSFFGLAVGAGGGAAVDRFAQFTILRASTQLGTALIGTNLAASSNHDATPNMLIIDAVAAGTYTYKVQVAMSSAYSDTTVQARQLKLTAYEL